MLLAGDRSPPRPAPSRREFAVETRKPCTRVLQTAPDWCGPLPISCSGGDENYQNGAKTGSCFCPPSVTWVDATACLSVVVSERTRAKAHMNSARADFGMSALDCRLENCRF